MLSLHHNGRRDIISLCIYYDLYAYTPFPRFYTSGRHAPSSSMLLNRKPLFDAIGLNAQLSKTKSDLT